MKFKKLLIISLISVILLSFFVVTVSAVEYNPDPSKFVVFIDDEYYYYDMIGITWEEYIENANSRVDDLPFAIIGDLVIYNNNYLTLKNKLVHSYDCIINSTGDCYYLGDNLYTVNDNELKFSSLVPETMTFAELINILPNSNFNLGGFNSNYVYYDSKQLIFNNSVRVSASHNVGSNTTFYIGEGCLHPSYRQTTIKLSNCTDIGSDLYHCLTCGYEWIVSVPVKSDQHTSEDANIEYIFATCTENGLKTYNCSRCGVLVEETLFAYGHQYSEVTCLEPARCNYCGIYTGSVSDHNLDFYGNCQTPGCDYSYYNVIGNNIKDTGNKFWNWLTGKYEDGKSWVDEQTSGLDDVSESINKGFRVILIILGIVAGLTLLSVLLNLIDKISKPIKNLNERFKRKNKRR